MADFTIDLTESKRADVTRFKITQVQVTDYYNVNTLRHESSSEPTYKLKAFKYIVSILNNEGSAEYSLYKFVSGEWFNDIEGKSHIEDSQLIEIKNAIIKREKESDNP